ncbi:hypothetical protein NNO02_14305, partial [Citrobacter sp. Awk 2]|uniref:hypothetical protein n=1 Tax=Citrobacter sp. Awk 2 TaxID=2963959 RepID=UPI0023025F21
PKNIHISRLILILKGYISGLVILPAIRLAATILPVIIKREICCQYRTMLFLMGRCYEYDENCEDGKNIN